MNALDQVDVFRIARIPYSKPDMAMAALSANEIMIMHLNAKRIQELIPLLDFGGINGSQIDAIGMFGLEFSNHIYMLIGSIRGGNGLKMIMKSDAGIVYYPILGYWIDSNELLDPLITTIKNVKDMVRAILEDVYSRSNLPTRA